MGSAGGGGREGKGRKGTRASSGGFLSSHSVRIERETCSNCRERVKDERSLCRRRGRERGGRNGWIRKCSSSVSTSPLELKFPFPPSSSAHRLTILINWSTAAFFTAQERLESTRTNSKPLLSKARANFDTLCTVDCYTFSL